MRKADLQFRDAASPTTLGDDRDALNLHVGVKLVKEGALELAAASRKIQDGLADLSSSEERYRLLVEEIRDYVVYMIDPQGMILTWNSGAQRVKGYTAEEAIGKNFSIFFLPERVAAGRPQEELLQAAQKGRFEDVDWRVRKDGSRFWANEIANTIRDQTGALKGFVKITRDLSERKTIEEALSRSERRYRMMVDEIKDYAIFMIDIEGKIATWNGGAEQILGFNEAEAVGQSGEIVFTPEDRASDQPAIELDIAKREGRALDERWHQRKDGSRFWASGVMTSIRDQDGSLHGFVKLMRDLTKQKQVEDQRGALLDAERVARAQAESVNRLKDDFLATLSHELRTPISAVAGWARLLRQKSTTEDERAYGLEVI